MFSHSRVLEVGCGRGYGPQLYAPKVEDFVWIDLSRHFLDEAKTLLPGYHFIQANGVDLPFRSGYFDTVIAFEVIEHISDDIGFIRELITVLTDKGRVAISTPNRLIASGSAVKPLDRFHVREYLAKEFHALLSQFFASVKIFGQFDKILAPSPGSRLLDRLGVRWKYILPASIQGKLSVAIRRPIRLEECQFKQEDLDSAHTLLALCEK